MVQDVVESLEFAQMLNTRFCHDMAGPVSAVNNGLDFLQAEDAQDMREQAFSLLSLSASESFAKLRMYRIAFGVAKPSLESPVDEMKEVVADYFKHGKITLDWPPRPEDGFQEKLMNPVRQMLACMMMITSSALIYGGNITVRRIADGDTRLIRISGEGQRIKDDDNLRNILIERRNEPELSSQNVPFYYARYLLEQQKMKWDVKVEANHIIFNMHY